MAGTDVALMLRVQGDDRDAFGGLYDRFGARAYRIAYAIVGDRTRAEDTVQEAFLSVWRSRGRYRADSGSVAGWILGTVRNRAIDSLRRNGRHDRQRVDEKYLDEQAAGQGSVEDLVGKRDEAARLRSTLARLPAAQRDVITLAYFGELSTSEIARELSIPLGTVKGRMRLGLDKLRDETVA